MQAHTHIYEAITTYLQNKSTILVHNVTFIYDNPPLKQWAPVFKKKLFGCDFIFQPGWQFSDSGETQFVKLAS